MIFPFRSRRVLPLIGMFSSMLILLMQDANPVRGDFISPSGLANGAEYRLIFVTADARNATSGSIAYYNDFVSEQAGLNKALPPGLTWRAIASTSAIDAKVNVGTESDIPIYDTQGRLIAEETSDLWNGLAIENAIDYDQFGMPVDDSMVWTGSDWNGTRIYINGSLYGPLGYSSDSTIFGSLGSKYKNRKWLYRGTLADSSEEHGFYALSSTITVAIVVPEPGTWILFGVGGLCMAAFSRLRRRR